MGPNGHVSALDHIEQLVELAKKNIAKGNPEVLPYVEFKVGNGFNGWPENGPYDAIYVGAAAKSIPNNLVVQLKPGGRMLLPVGPASSFHYIIQVDKLQDGSVITKSLGTTPVRFTPLIDKAKQLAGGHLGGRTRIINAADRRVLVLPNVVAAPDATPEEIMKFGSVIKDD